MIDDDDDDDVVAVAPCVFLVLKLMMVGASSGITPPLSELLVLDDADADAALAEVAVADPSAFFLFELKPPPFSTPFFSLFLFGADVAVAEIPEKAFNQLSSS